MKLWISLILFFIFIFNGLCFAKQEKHVFNSKIERSSKYNCGWCNNKEGGHCGTMGGCKTIYIYKYPKSIDKMIKENPEFKNEIVGKAISMNTDLYLDCCQEENSNKYSYEACKNMTSEDRERNTILVENCYDLWKYDPKMYDTLGIKVKFAFEQHCNKIVKKILKKTGRLY